MPRYYVEMDGYRYGPFDLAELSQLRRDGVIPGGCRAAEEHSDANGTVDQLLAAHSDEGLSGPATDAAPQPTAPVGTVAAAPAVDPAPPQAPAAPVLEQTMPSQPHMAQAPRTSWSERLAQLRAQSPVPATPAAEIAVSGPTLSEPVPHVIETVIPEPAIPMNSPAQAGKNLPEPLLAGGSNIEPDVQYASALKDDPPEPVSPDDTLPSLNLGGLTSKPSAAGVNSALPPLGYSDHDASEDAPPEWVIQPSAPAVQNSGFGGGPSASVSEPEPVPAISGIPGFAAAPQPPVQQAESPQQPADVTIPEEIPAESGPAMTPGLGGTWKERMSRLDEVYGASPKMPPMPPGGSGLDAGPPPEPGVTPTAPEILEKDSTEGETSQNGSALLAGIAILVAGAIGLTTGYELLEVSAGPVMIMAGAMAAFGALTLIGGLLLCLGLRWAGVMAAILLIVPLAVLGLAGYHQKEAFMALDIPPDLMKPMTYGFASLLMGALGASLSQKRRANGDIGS